MKKINLKESLKKMDIDSDFQFHLTELYEACKLDDEKKKKLVQYIDGYDIEGTNKLLSNTAASQGLMEMCEDDLTDDELRESVRKIYDDDDCLELTGYHIYELKDFAYQSLRTELEAEDIAINSFDFDSFGVQDIKCDDVECIVTGKLYGPLGDYEVSFAVNKQSDDEVDESLNEDTVVNTDIIDTLQTKLLEIPDTELCNHSRSSEFDILTRTQDNYPAIVAMISPQAKEVSVVDKTQSPWIKYFDGKIETEADIQKVVDAFNSAIQNLDSSNFKSSESLTEDVDKSSIESDITSAALKFFKEKGLEEQEDYLNVEVSDTENKLIKVEVRAELSYNELTALADVLDKVVAKYDDEAYFEPETAGIITAFIDNDPQPEKVDDDIASYWKDKFAKCTTFEQLKSVYREFVDVRDFFNGPTVDSIYTVVDKKVEETKPVNEGFTDILKGVGSAIKSGAKSFGQSLKVAGQNVKDAFNDTIDQKVQDSSTMARINRTANQAQSEEDKNIAAYVKEKDGKLIQVDKAKYDRMSETEKKKHKPVMKESFDNDDDMYYDFEGDDFSVAEGKDFDAEGVEYKYVRRHGDVLHLDFDNWAVWEAENQENGEVAFFIVDEDTGFIDWGPVDTVEEAKEFLDSKANDYDDDDYSDDIDEWFVGEPDPTGELEGKARNAQRIKTWHDAYAQFQNIIEKNFPDEDKIHNEVRNLVKNNHESNPAYWEAWKRWIDNYDEEAAYIALYPNEDDIDEAYMDFEIAPVDYCPSCAERALEGKGDGVAICSKCNARYEVIPMPNNRVRYIEIKENINEDINTHLYLFPELTDEDIEMLKVYGLKYAGKNHGASGDENNWVVTGTESALRRYADNYLGYELHPNYLYEIDDFAGEIINESADNTVDMTTTIHRAVDEIIAKKDSYENNDDLCDAIYSAIANELSGLEFVDKNRADIIDSIYNKELARVNVIDESIKEGYRGDDGLDDILGWLQDHEQAWDDFCVHFEDVEDEDLTQDMVVDWISEHEQLYDDFLSYFGEDEFLDESKSTRESYRQDAPNNVYEIGDRVAQRWADEFNVGTVVDIKEEDGIQYLVEWDYSDGPDAEWVYGDVISLWIEEDNIDESKFIKEENDEIEDKSNISNMKVGEEKVLDLNDASKFDNITKLHIIRKDDDKYSLFYSDDSGKEKANETNNSTLENALYWIRKETTINESIDADFSDDELASIYGGDTKNDTPDGIETPEETEARLAKEDALKESVTMPQSVIDRIVKDFTTLFNLTESEQQDLQQDLQNGRAEDWVDFVAIELGIKKPSDIKHIKNGSVREFFLYCNKEDYDKLENEFWADDLEESKLTEASANVIRLTNDFFYDYTSNIEANGWDEVIEIFRDNGWVNDNEQMIIPAGTKLRKVDHNLYYNFYKVIGSKNKTHIPILIESENELSQSDNIDNTNSVLDSDMTWICKGTQVKFKNKPNKVYEIVGFYTPPPNADFVVCLQYLNKSGIPVGSGIYRNASDLTKLKNSGGLTVLTNKINREW